MGGARLEALINENKATLVELEQVWQDDDILKEKISTDIGKTLFKISELNLTNMSPYNLVEALVHQTKVR